VLLAMPGYAALAQRPPDPEITLKAQREAMAPLSFMDGAWRGRIGDTAWPAGGAISQK
jgi:hypothetical protein